MRRDKPGKSDGHRPAIPEVADNTLICLINQASTLLGRQFEALEQQFLEEGGFTERLSRKLQEERGRR